MGYLNPIMTYGEDKFFNDCNVLGVDGVIIVDLPPEEAGYLTQKVQQNSLPLIRLLTPTTTLSRLPLITAQAGGFLYYVSVAGVTGKQSADAGAVGAHLGAIRPHTPLPIMAGFGIKTPEDARAMAAVSDGVVVGSALVEAAANGGVGAALTLAKQIRDAL
jgi:tryptophan synthase alpha chain